MSGPGPDLDAARRWAYALTTAVHAADLPSAWALIAEASPAGVYALALLAAGELAAGELGFDELGLLALAAELDWDAVQEGP